MSPSDTPPGGHPIEISFNRYRPNVWVLRKFSLNMEEGKKYALVGPSGSGKSTVAWLLERFYDPEAGSIMIDGFNLKTLDPQYLRNQISLVSQVLFHLFSLLHLPLCPRLLSYSFD